MQNWNPLSKKVASRIEELIAAGEDTRLPSQRELSSQFGVSRTSVREALSLLEASGKLRTEPGRGSFWVASPEGPLFEDTAARGGERPVFPPNKVYPKSEISRFRYLIEGQSSKLAAMRITDEEIQQLERNLATFKAQTRAMDLTSSAETDLEFHRLIVRFSGVALFIDLHDAFHGAILKAIPMYEHRKRAWEPVTEHERIFEALHRHDPDEALYYSQSHIVRSAERLGMVNANETL